MLIFAIFVSITIAVAAITLYISCSYVETKGYMRGLEEAEKIMREVKDERV